MNDFARFTHPILVLGLSLAATAAACGSNVTQANSDSSSGSGGSGSGQGSTTAVSAASTGVGASVTSGMGGATVTTSTTGAAVTTATVAASSSTGPWTSEAQFPAPPQVQYYGGEVLISPNIYGIFFSSDDASTVSSLTDFTTKIGGTPYWTATTSEYGVGPATAQTITLTESPGTNLNDQGIQQWLAGKFGTDPNFPATPGSDDLYIIYYPSGVNIDLYGTQSCQYFGGYHNETSVQGQHVAYAVVPRCQYPGMSALSTTTSSASHELIEAATDPYPQTSPAYAVVDDTDIYWLDALGAGEVGDMCAQQPQNFTTFPGFNYVVQRSWSNAAANAGNDPCQPEPQGEVYYNAAPVLTDTVNYTIQFQKVPVRGIKIPVGQSATVPVDFYSDAPMGPWPAQGYDYSSTFMGGPQLLTLTLNPPSGQNGTQGTLTIKVNQAGQNNQEIFFIASSTNGGATVNWSFGVVTN
jgi:hypothetical protein